MLAEAHSPPTSLFELTEQGLREEHAACVERIGCMAADPMRQGEIQAYLQRIESINKALIRLAGLQEPGAIG